MITYSLAIFIAICAQGHSTNGLRRGVVLRWSPSEFVNTESSYFGKQDIVVDDKIKGLTNKWYQILCVVKKTPEVSSPPATVILRTSDGQDLDHFSVTGCDLSDLQDSVRGMDSDKMDQLVFRHHTGNCYARTYELGASDLTAWVQRSEAFEVDCSPEMGSQTKSSGVVKNLGRSGKFIQRRIPGFTTVRRQKISCGKTKNFKGNCWIQGNVKNLRVDLSSMTADVLINNVLVERFEVSSYKRYSLMASIRINSVSVSGDKTSVGLVLLNSKGVCYRRAYVVTTSKHHDDLVHEHVVERQTPKNINCPQYMINKGLLGRTVGGIKSTARIVGLVSSNVVVEGMRGNFIL